ncbi:hypothetical protein HW511_13430 [Asaia siamensis]|uniref:hypothetical protein n=1 Tax=Asaia siamensis TaxID=110479 RepID=UPI00166880AA|nr:hypothetical protein [Asaia siamensis]
MPISTMREGWVKGHQWNDIEARSRPIVNDRGAVGRAWRIAIAAERISVNRAFRGRRAVAAAMARHSLRFFRKAAELLVASE